MGKASPKKAAHPAFLAEQVKDSRYFFLNLAPSPQSSLTVVCGGWERCAPDYRIARTDFEFFGIEYVARGKGLLTLNGVESSLAPGSIFAYRPFTAHTIQTDPNDPLVKYFIDFAGRNANQLIGPKIFGSDGVAWFHQPQLIHHLYEQIMEAGLSGGVLAQRLCAHLLELLSLRVEENARTTPEMHSRARQSFERCRDELQKHFRTIHSISELATLTHFDPAYLSRLFHQFVGESPHEMLTRLKMNEAAAHLIGGRHTVKEVAAKVGFSDPYHFSRAFKKHHGIPPIRFQGTRARQ